MKYFQLARMKKPSTILQIVAYLAFSWTYCIAQPEVIIVPYATGFSHPTKITHANDSRLFVTENTGKVKIIKNGIVLNTPFLDLSDKINNPVWAGIYSMVFDPNYETNGYFYVMYVVKDGPIEKKYEVQISRFSRNGDANSDIADPEEYKILNIQYTDVLGGHKGGDIVFGSDGQLYISTGDNGPGSTGDPNNNSQNMGLLYGKLLKFDPNNPPSPTEALDHIWALGLRNPWRMSIDATTNDLWIGDNGQDGWEEVNSLPYSNQNTPQNFGWNYMEGNAVYRDCSCDIATSFIPPKFVFAGYDNNGGSSASVIGGFVYRGSSYPALQGTYFFGDYQSHKIGIIQPSGYSGFLPSTTYPSIVSFGEDNQGELYVASFNEGTIGKITSVTNPLPVRLEYFTIKNQNKNVLLEWSTAFETNFSHFEIEKSTNGRLFNTIGWAENSNSQTKYSHTDVITDNTKNYYRLKMVDLDGTFAYSRILESPHNEIKTEVVLFPNPNTGYLNITGSKIGETVSIYDEKGILQLTEEAHFKVIEKINLENLEKGVYIFQITNQKGAIFSQKFIIR
tara:strand:+ start:750 stop:2441 length:1692 start_codon:yes stop_codon:yes gene_type:complete